jgi:prepilin-type N-terminal cleavage/methylation domain-containing protein
VFLDDNPSTGWLNLEYGVGMRTSSPQAGFTLLEMMIVVALIAVLAAIAIPAFSGESKKARAESEVMPFLVEIGNKQEAFAQTHPGYQSTLQWFTIPAGTWTDLRIEPPNDKGRCIYFTRGGDASEAAGNLPDAELAACNISYDPPAMNFYYALAMCDMDGDGINSCYMISSDNSTLTKIRPGE